jgi:bisphosphoglycerate-independent phosphoglycerate mutase (AlkP superfamily)
MIIRSIGGGYLEAVFNVVQRNYESGKIESVVERVFGQDTEELWDRIRQRFPRYRENYRQPWRRR